MQFCVLGWNTLQKWKKSFHSMTLPAILPKDTIQCVGKLLSVSTGLLVGFARFLHTLQVSWLASFGTELLIVALSSFTLSNCRSWIRLYKLELGVRNLIVDQHLGAGWLVVLTTYSDLAMTQSWVATHGWRNTGLVYSVEVYADPAKGDDRSKLHPSLLCC